jgi:hypothetical protein
MLPGKSRGLCRLLRALARLIPVSNVPGYLHEATEIA